MVASTSETEIIEVEVVLRCLLARSGVDFRQYSRPFLVRNLKRVAEFMNLRHISELVPQIMHSKEVCLTVIKSLSVSVTGFFRSPLDFSELVDELFPIFHSYPFIRIWHAGCSSGEEVYSMAILLHEAGLLERSLIYATDFNATVLYKAKWGIYAYKDIEKANERYRMAGGKAHIANYFQSNNEIAKVSNALRNRIVFGQHNLTTDSVFGEMDLIVCKNVLIYFNSTLKDRLAKLFVSSLCHNGYLSLGRAESLKSFVRNTCNNGNGVSSTIHRKPDLVSTEF